MILELALVGGILAVFVLSRAPTLDQPLVEAHGFRQTQTTYGAVLFQEDGIDWLRPRLPVFGRDSAVPLEFPLFQAIASVPIDMGADPGVATRTTSLVFFVATAAALWALLRRLEGRLVALVALVVFCFSPFALQWSRAALIEYLATAAGVLFVWGGFECGRTFRRSVFAATMLAGTVAFLVKPTTAVAYLLPLAAVSGLLARDATRRERLRTLALFVVPVVVGLVWTVHADAVKRANPFSAELTSSALRHWNFGSLAQRFEPRSWTAIADVGNLIAGSALLLAVGLFAAWRSTRRWMWLGWVAGAIATPMVFFNLYVVHDYYFAAITPLVAGVLGMGIAAVARFVTNDGARGGAIASAAVLMLLLGAWGFDSLRGTGDYWRLPNQDDPDPNGIRALAAELDEVSSTDELAVLTGMDYSPEVFFFARRQGTAIPLPGWSWPAEITPELIDTLVPDHRLLVAVDPSAPDVEIIRRWDWYTPVAPHVYRMAPDRETLLDDHAVAATASPAVADDIGGSDGEPLHLGCTPDQWLQLPAGSVLRFDSSPAGARLTTGDDRAPMPVPLALVVAEDGGSVSVGCTGTDELFAHLTR